MLLPALKNLLQTPGHGPVVIAEPADNIGGGAPGDGTGLLRHFIRHRLANSAVVIDDPVAVRTVAEEPVGTRRCLEIGGRHTKLPGAEAICLDVEIVGRTDGKFELEDHKSHLATMYGINIDMGPCVTLRHRLPGGGGIWILLTSKKTAPFDLGQLRSQGIEPEKMSLIGAKAAVAHRRAYEPIARALFTVNTPGPCTSDLRTLPYQRIRRPVFPLDEMQETGTIS
jgi:microcystin degradation protein MlrC